MIRKNIVEDILVEKYLKKLTENMYWNNNNNEILVYVKANIDFKEINPKLLVDTLLKMDNYENQFWFMSPAFDTSLVKKLITSGFEIYLQRNYVNKINKKWSWDDKYFNKKYISSKLMMIGMIPNKYAVLYLNNVHEPKSASRLLKKYELKIDSDFDKIVDKCSEIHDDRWLFKEMKDYYKKIYRENDINFKFTSFALYRNNELKAGEFGCIIGKIYYSYSGYHEESSAGTVQMIKMFRYLKKNGFLCCNLGPASEEEYKYKYKLGAIDISRNEYLKLLFEQNNSDSFSIPGLESPS
jgi:Leu/Phe-tRNA-protein transferase